LIKDNNLGFATNAGDSIALAKIFNSLSNIDDPQYQKMKSNCKDLYESRFLSSLRKQELLNLL